MTPSALPGRLFSHHTFARFTPELDGHERMRVFFRLPEDLQKQAWSELDRQIHVRSDALWLEVLEP